MDIVSDIWVKLVNSSSLFEAEELVLREMMQVARLLMGRYLEALDEQLLVEKKSTWKMVNRQARTVNFAFGPVTFKRRYYCDSRGRGHFALDERLKLVRRKRVSPGLRMMMAKVCQVTTMRNTADVINLLLGSGVSVNAVMTAVHELGEAVTAQSQANEQKPAERRVPKNLVIEGDATMIKIKRKGKQPAYWHSAHHYRIYEKRVVGKGKEQSVYHLNQRDFISFAHESLKERVREYLTTHYDLAGQTVFMASDGGPGYEPESFFGLLPNRQTKGEFFIDRYHSLKKIQDCFGVNDPMTPAIEQALRNYDYDGLMTRIDTGTSRLTTAAQYEAADRLKAYFKRNWAYCATPAQRGYVGLGLFGSIESSHRSFTYRMKRQGKSWTINGAKAMLGLVEARKNGELIQNLRTCLKQETRLPKVPLTALQRRRISVPQYLKRTTKPSCGALTGGFALDAATSSPIGHLVKSLSH